MKKTVLTWGLITGALLSAMMVLTIPFVDRIGFDKSEVLGYTTMVLSGLLVFFGVRSYRQNARGGRLTFGRGFLVGLLIVLVSAVCYVGTWQVVYYTMVPDFMDKYAVCMIDKARASGASPEKMEQVRKQAEDFKRLYANPVFNVALSFLEPLPIGLLAAAVSAAVLRRR